ncbi:hypothetical protein [Ornithobacterium rhinotracheale]|uniref:hypothetical protein n=1 Tax=Ornithobacterium rhinotracheale TaxID=28251 RepID=UPI004035346E
MKKIDEIKKDLGITNQELADWFGYKNANAFRTSKAYERIKSGLEEFYHHIKLKETNR